MITPIKEQLIRLINGTEIEDWSLEQDTKPVSSKDGFDHFIPIGNYTLTMKLKKQEVA